MTTKLEKLEKQKATIPTIPIQKQPPITQTIIINSPNININYHHQKAPSPIDNGYSSKGLDNWNLNNNLKEFSQTRQLGFFREGKKTQKEPFNPRNKSVSPYHIHKVRTTQIRNNPIKINPLRHQHSTLNHIPNTTRTIHEQPKNETINLLEKAIIDQNRQTKYNKNNKYINIQIKKQPTKQIISQRKLESLSKTGLGDVFWKNPEEKKKEKERKVGIRKNRFEYVITPQSVGEEKVESKHSQQFYDEELLAPKNTQEEVPSPTKLALSLRNKTYSKAIDSINKTFLSSCDSYLDTIQFTDIKAQPQIQVCVNSMSQPQYKQCLKEKSRQVVVSQLNDYQFGFQERGRPRPVRRKKGYQVFEE